MIYGLEKQIIHCISFLPPLSGKSKWKNQAENQELTQLERKPLILHRVMKIDIQH